MSKPFPLFKRPKLKRSGREYLRPLRATVFLNLIRKYQKTELPLATVASWYMYKDPCVYCYGVADTWDHLLAKSKIRGVIDDSHHNNKVPSCRKCNVKKGPRSVLQYLVAAAQARRQCSKGHPKLSTDKVCRVCVAASNRCSALKRLRFSKRRGLGAVGAA